ncbi:MAG: hypothetical protein Q4F27_06565, partial [Desulfovibrionaceae bacterium]|nr:hypothetical protein [Desulfovibrionaceae bacterium]
MSVRDVSSSTQWQQLGNAWSEWLDTSFRFFHGPWPWLLILLVLLLHMASPSAPAGAGKSTGLRRPVHWLMVLAPPCAYCVLSGLLAVLHALSDQTLTESAKYAGGLAVYAALACGLSFWRLTLPLAPLLRRLSPVLLLVPFIVICCTSGNLPRVWASLTDGQMAELDARLTARQDWLYSLGATAFGPDAAPRFGLAGEICRPGVRRR